MSAYIPTETKHVPTETRHREPERPQRNREDALRLLRQLMAQGARVVRLGGRRRRDARSS